MDQGSRFGRPLTESPVTLPPFLGSIIMPNSNNLLLASLSASDVAALRPHLKPVHLEHEMILFEGGGKVAAIYFPTGAIVSLVVGLSSGEMIEAAMVGKMGWWAHLPRLT